MVVIALDGIMSSTAEVTQLCNVLNAYDAKLRPYAHILLLIKDAKQESRSCFSSCNLISSMAAAQEF